MLSQERVIALDFQPFAHGEETLSAVAHFAYNEDAPPLHAQVPYNDTMNILTIRSFARCVITKLALIRRGNEYELMLKVSEKFYRMLDTKGTCINNWQTFDGRVKMSSWDPFKYLASSQSQRPHLLPNSNTTDIRKSDFINFSISNQTPKNTLSELINRLNHTRAIKSNADFIDGTKANVRFIKNRNDAGMKLLMINRENSDSKRIRADGRRLLKCRNDWKAAKLLISLYENFQQFQPK
ncbi:unnamed protein product [Caenorhabditis nigoni]